MNEAKRPVFLIGSGIRSAHAIEEFKQLADKTQIPVAFSASAVDTYGISHELSMGTVGTIGGSRAGNFVVQNADLVITVGSRNNIRQVSYNWENYAKNADLVFHPSMVYI